MQKLLLNSMNPEIADCSSSGKIQCNSVTGDSRAAVKCNGELYEAAITGILTFIIGALSLTLDLQLYKKELKSD